MTVYRQRKALQRQLSKRHVQLLTVLAVCAVYWLVSRGANRPGTHLRRPATRPLDMEMRYAELGNYEPKEPEVASSQPGENGAAVRLTGERGEAASRVAVSEYGFNSYVSDKIALNRTIPDTRMSECKYWNYPEALPTVSVVIVFHNEAWSSLLRTVHTVLQRSPASLLHEIVMVDDYSTKRHLKHKLDKYLRSQFGGRVRLLRTTDRLGLIGARNFGARAARAEVVVFLDAHCEVNTNWLPPLLAPIKANRTVMTVPVVDSIDTQTWEYRSTYGASDSHHSGKFEWGLLYKETLIGESEKDSRPYPSMPFRSPTHAGGLFAIERSWFEELGFYDEGLKIWGGEQYELSFKIWMCGGGILFVPCSHVGHVYRHHMPYNYGKYSGRPVVAMNMMRVVKTWMGDYARYYLTREPQTARIEPGDLTSQLELKDRLQCRDFKWYMDNVAYDVLRSYPLPPPNVVWGQARNHASSYCLERKGAIPGSLGASPCGNGGQQLLRLNEQGQLGQGEWCLTPEAGRIRADHCVKGTVDGPWSYDAAKEQIRTRSGMCITVEEGDAQLADCEEGNASQRFVWKEIYE